jgi:hypothetical protein
VLLDDVLGSVEQQLQRGKSLLAIDHMANSDETRGDELLVKNDRPEKVRRHRSRAVAGRRVKEAFSDRAHVFPEWLPLLVKFPHVRPLEQRHDIPDVITEDPSWSECLCLHRSP